MTMDHFFSHAGELLRSHTYAMGEYPTRTWYAEFNHTHGTAIYDGQTWTFTLTTPTP